MIRESNAPKAYVHKTDFEKTVDVAALHAGKPIRRITHTNDIYPPKVSEVRRASRKRNTESKIIDRINKLMAWMKKQSEPVTRDQMERYVKYRLHGGHRNNRIECTLTYLMAHGYIEQVVKPAKGRKSLYRALKSAY